MRYAIWYHLYNLKNVKNTHGGVLLLVKLQVLACFSCFLNKQGYKVVRGGFGAYGFSEFLLRQPIYQLIILNWKTMFYNIILQIKASSQHQLSLYIIKNEYSKLTLLKALLS